MRQTVRYAIVCLGMMLAIGCGARHVLAPETTESLSHDNALTLERFNDELWNVIVSEHI